MPTPESATTIWNAIRRGADPDGDVAAPGRELDGVADEVGHDLPDPDGIVADPEGMLRQANGEVDPPAPRGRLGLLHGLLDGRPDVVRPEVEEDEAGIELRELEQVLGQPVEAFELDAAGLHELGTGGGILARPFAEELV